MSDTRPHPDDDLPPELARLADWALQGLDDDASLDPAAAAEWERLAALAAVAELPADPLPAGLQARLREQARAFERPLAASAFKASMTWLGWFGWAVAAGIAVAWLLPARGPASVADARAKLLAEAPDAKVMSWAASQHADALQATGDVVWSDARQEGYLRFRGLRAHDPKVAQYQLWIFDPARDQRYPVDGGVFDVVADSETVVPIKAALRVTGPTLFAVTRERPGGVVVSDRTQLALAAPVK